MVAEAISMPASKAPPRSDVSFHLVAAFLTIGAAVAAFAVWTPFGFAATFVLTASRVRGWFVARPRWNAWSRRVLASVFAALAARLALDDVR